MAGTQAKRSSIEYATGRVGPRTAAKTRARIRRHLRVRKKVTGDAVRPRLVVNRSAKHIFVQVVDDTAGLFGTMRPEGRVAAIRELVRVLRPGGRVLVIGAAPRGGLGAVLSRTQSGPPFVASGDANKALEADGFRSVRTLAEREGLVFVEGIKPRV